MQPGLLMGLFLWLTFCSLHDPCGRWWGRCIPALNPSGLGSAGLGLLLCEVVVVGRTPRTHYTVTGMPAPPSPLWLVLRTFFRSQNSLMGYHSMAKVGFKVLTFKKIALKPSC